MNTRPDGERHLVARYECMDCGQVGSDVDLRSHAQSEGCKNFRTTTTLMSSSGRFLGERIEVTQC